MVDEHVAISLVIPAYNEEKLLPRLLESVDIAANRFKLGAEKIEIIVANNASTDATSQISKQSNCIVVDVEKRMIAAARNGGAEAAKGKIIAFVDADSVIHPEIFNKIKTSLADDKVIGGATGINFDRSSMGINFTFAMVKPMIQLMGLESGVVFCRRKDFLAVNGYPEDELVAEDVKFLKNLKAYGKKQGRRFRVLKGAITLTSSRKFDQYGDWHFFKVMPKMIFLKLFSKNKFKEFIDGYWYKR